MLARRRRSLVRALCVGEIDELEEEAAVAGDCLDEDVGGLDVAVGDALSLEEVDGGEHLDGQGMEGGCFVDEVVVNGHDGGDVASPQGGDDEGHVRPQKSVQERRDMAMGAAPEGDDFLL